MILEKDGESKSFQFSSENAFKYKKILSLDKNCKFGWAIKFEPPRAKREILEHV